MKELRTYKFYSGLCGLQVPVPKYKFPEPYKDVSRLTYYSTFFNSIEINSSFYKVPLPKTVKNWEDSVNENFKFSFKLWRQITHAKHLNFKEEDVLFFFKSLALLAYKHACLLIQFPASLGSAHIGQLEQLLTLIHGIDRDQKWKIVVEFRNKSWYEAKTYDLLEAYHASLVMHDMPKSATPKTEQKTDVVYMRFHGPTGDYKGNYSEAFLGEYAMLTKEFLEEGKQVYVYFNNTAGDAFKNLELFNRLML